MALVGYVPPECTVPLGTWNFEFFFNWKRPGCHWNFPFNHEKKKKNIELSLSRISVTAINGVVPVVECMLPSCIPTQKHINSCSFNVMDSRFWKAFVLPVHAKTIDLCLIQDRNQLLKTKLFRKTHSWPYAKVLFYYSLSKFLILDSASKLFVNSNLQFLSCF